MFHVKHSIKYYMEEKYYEEIIKLAKKDYKKGEVPVGAIVVKDGKILSKAYNRVEKDRDATMHAEILAIKKASEKIKNWRLNNCEMYVTLEPCPMCAGAILNSRISRVVYGSPDSRFGGCGTTVDVISNNALKRDVVITSGVLAEECLGLLQLFFQEMRARKGDTGAKPL